MRYLVYFGRLLRSFIYDFRRLLSDETRQRISHRDFVSYRAARLYPGYLQFGAAMEGVRPLALRYCKGRGVDIGAGVWPLPGARAIENGPHENAYRIEEPAGALDFVFSSHVLEHLDDPERALKEWTRVLAPGGIMVLYLPHPACRMWHPQHNPHHLWQPDPCVLEDRFRASGEFDVEYATHLPDGMLSFVLVVRRRGGASAAPRSDP